MAYSIFITPDNGESEVEVVVEDHLFLPTVAPGDTVYEFQSLTDAVLVLDEINSPGWFQTAIGLNRFVTSEFDPLRTSVDNLAELKGFLGTFNIGIRLKKFAEFEDILESAAMIRTASRFLEIIRPSYTQFAFLGDFRFEEGDNADTLGDVGPTFVDFGPGENFGTPPPGFVGSRTKKNIHQTINDNIVNQLFPPHQVRSPAAFTNFQDYYDSANGAPVYNLDDDYLGLTEDLDTKHKFPGSGGMFLDESDPVYQTFRDTRNSAVITPITFTFNPPPGNYVEPFILSIATNRFAEILYTLDGSPPAFFNNPTPQNGFRLVDKFLVRAGTVNLTLLARDADSNLSGVQTASYVVAPSMPEIRIDPLGQVVADSALPSNTDSIVPIGNVPVELRFYSQDPGLRIWYTVDGSAPSDVVFEDVFRLNGLRLQWAAPAAIKLNDHNIPVDFLRGRATSNVDGERNFMISSKPFHRYWGYAERTTEGRWGLSFKTFNDTPAPLPNTDSRILIGFAITNSIGEFTPESITNAVDAKAPKELFKTPVDPTLVGLAFPPQTKPLNDLHPVAVANDILGRTVKFFSKTSLGLFDPTRAYKYVFNSVAPQTTLESAITNAPFAKTLRLEVKSNIPDATVFWSTDTVAVGNPLFGQIEKLVNSTNQTFLGIAHTIANKIAPTVANFALTFKKFDALGRAVLIPTTGDVKNATPIDIPVEPKQAFFDVYVTPDVEAPDKWRFLIGEANKAVLERTDRILVARVMTDVDGVVDIDNNKGLIVVAVSSPALHPVVILTKKYLEPLFFNITDPNYLITFCWYAITADGAVEKVQTAVFSSS